MRFGSVRALGALSLTLLAGTIFAPQANAYFDTSINGPFGFSGSWFDLYSNSTGTLLTNSAVSIVTPYGNDTHSDYSDLNVIEISPDITYNTGERFGLIEVCLARESEDGSPDVCWNGSSWVEQEVWYPSTKKGELYFEGRFPSPAQLPAGIYRLRARGTSSARKTYISNIERIRVGGNFDGPIVINTPVLEDVYQPQSLTSLKFDSEYKTIIGNPSTRQITYDPQVTSAQVLFSRDAFGSSPAAYWSGSAWTATDTGGRVTATRDSVNTLGFTAPMPTTGLATGRYRAKIFYNTVDLGSLTAEVSFIIDGNAPIVDITTPDNNVYYPSLSSATINVSDGSFTSGIAKVETLLYRYGTSGGNAGYWDGAGYVYPSTAGCYRPVTTRSGNTWTAALPLGSNFVVGKYAIQAFATDNAGNRTASSLIYFWVTGPSSVRASSAVINTAAGTLTINFSGPVNSTDALTAANYAVQVNGVARTIQNITMPNSSSVTLSLGTLSSGNAVRFWWQGIRDTTGKAVVPGNATYTAP